MIRDPDKEAEFALFEARFGKDAVNRMIDEGVDMLKFKLFKLEEEVNPDEIIVTSAEFPREAIEDPSLKLVLRFRVLYPRTDKATGKHIPPTVIIWGEFPKNCENSSGWKVDSTCTQ